MCLPAVDKGISDHAPAFWKISFVESRGTNDCCMKTPKMFTQGPGYQKHIDWLTKDMLEEPILESEREFLVECHQEAD